MPPRCWPRRATASDRPVPSRGYGTARFLSDDTPRNGQAGGPGSNLHGTALMDGLGIESTMWLASTGGPGRPTSSRRCGPERCTALISVSGYLIGGRAIARPGATAATGRTGLVVPVLFRHRPRPGRLRRGPRRAELSKLIWRLASPRWDFDDATFAHSAAAFDNPDHVAIVIHNYRWRLGLGAGESRYDDLERRLAGFPAITVPTITLEEDANGAPHPDASAYASKFTASTSTGSSMAVSGTTCRKRPAGFRRGHHRRRQLLTQG